MPFSAPCPGRLREGCHRRGTCTYLCPTCHCFEIKDTEENEIVRAAVLGTVACIPALPCTPAATIPAAKAGALPQRALHKYVYLPQNRLYRITGCGRCIRYCPGGLNIKNAVADIQKQRGSTGCLTKTDLPVRATILDVSRRPPPTRRTSNLYAEIGYPAFLPAGPSSWK